MWCQISIYTVSRKRCLTTYIVIREHRTAKLSSQRLNIVILLCRISVFFHMRFKRAHIVCRWIWDTRCKWKYIRKYFQMLHYKKPYNDKLCHSLQQFLRFIMSVIAIRYTAYRLEVHTQMFVNCTALYKCVLSTAYSCCNILHRFNL